MVVYGGIMGIKRKAEIFEIDIIIGKLQKLFEEDIVDSFITHKRYDLLAGYVNTDKVNQVSKSGYTYSNVDFGDDGKISISKEHIVMDDKDGQEDLPEQSFFHLKYYNKLDLKIEQAYNKHVVGKNIQPKLNWKKECREYLSDQYLDELFKAQDLVLEQGNAWDVISFASRVPCANIGKLEDKVIAMNDSLLILAFALDVSGANIAKLRKAIERVGNTRSTIENAELIDHVAMFHSAFGFGEIEGIQPEA